MSQWVTWILLDSFRSFGRRHVGRWITKVWGRRNPFIRSWRSLRGRNRFFLLSRIILISITIKNTSQVGVPNTQSQNFYDIFSLDTSCIGIIISFYFNRRHSISVIPLIILVSLKSSGAWCDQMIVCFCDASFLLYACKHFAISGCGWPANILLCKLEALIISIADVSLTDLSWIVYQSRESGTFRCWAQFRFQYIGNKALKLLSICSAIDHSGGYECSGICPIGLVVNEPFCEIDIWIYWMHERLEIFNTHT